MGFVGFAMCIALASSKDKDGNFYDVIGVEKNTKEGMNKVQKINKGELPINSIE